MAVLIMLQAHLNTSIHTEELFSKQKTCYSHIVADFPTHTASHSSLSGSVWLERERDKVGYYQ